MANQDNLSIGGIGADPSGAYTQIEAGWDPTYADGGVTWRPTSSSFTTLVADTGDVAQTETKAADGDGWIDHPSSNDTYAIQSVPAGSTVATDYVSIVVTDNTGSAGNGTFTLESSEITSINSAGVITFTGNAAFVSECVMVISYNANIDEAVATNSSEAVCVKGATDLHIYHPASGNSEVLAKFQWTDNEDLSIDGVAQATWQDITSATASAQAKLLLDPSVNADWAKLDKMAYIRLTAISTDADVGGVADVTAYEHPSTGAYISYAEDKTTENMGSFSIGGIGADPS
tara:strand:+ start:207 stop:1073 length:867 start_codon:yes stop_codon:yes gene_type:complete